MIRRLLLGLLIMVGMLLLTAVVAALLVDPSSRASTLPERVEEPGLSHFLSVPLAGTDGLDIHYIEAPGPEDSDAPAFVLLHGFTFNAFTWTAQMPRLSAVGRTLAPDQIPYGLSEKPIASDWRDINPYAREAAVAQVMGFMDALGLDRVILVGNSSGGTLALEVALADSERVVGLVLVAPWVFVRRPVIPSFIADSLPMRRLSLFIARRLGSDGGLLEFSYADPSRISAERRRLAALHTLMRNWDLAWAELLTRSLSTPVEVSARLDELRQPVLVVSGDADRLVPLEDSRVVADRLPRASFETISDCGHVPHEECPERFGEILESWLRGNGDGLEQAGLRAG
ncbi:MAG: alpha/beta hydrolase [Chromatiales bacterium]